ncbi:MAG: hypothetical protein ACREXR_19570 [Gammaproteobacteria bacterium]
MKASVPIGPHIFEIDISLFGGEKYFVDGKLIDRKWSLSFESIREYEIGGQVARVEFYAKQNKYSYQLFVNDKLHVADLFPELTKKMESRNLKNKGPNWKIVLIIFILSMAATILYKAQW